MAADAGVIPTRQVIEATTSSPLRGDTSPHGSGHCRWRSPGLSWETQGEGGPSVGAGLVLVRCSPRLKELEFGEQGLQTTAW